MNDKEIIKKLEKSIQRFESFLIWETCFAFCRSCNSIEYKRDFVDRIAYEKCLNCAKDEVIDSLKKQFPHPK